jgi:hypothetical protein
MVAKNDVEQPTHSSHPFMLRLWLEDLGSGQTDWRGKVQHVNSGEARYFRDWLTLEAFVDGGCCARSTRQGLARMGDRKPTGPLQRHGWKPAARRPPRYEMSAEGGNAK